MLEAVSLDFDVIMSFCADGTSPFDDYVVAVPGKYSKAKIAV